VTLLHGLGHIASGRLRSQPGMVLIKPSAVAFTGTSATIGANGQVTFSALTSLSLDDCFTADFDNYVVALTGTISSTGFIRWRMYDGSAAVTTGTYTIQHINVNGTSVTSGRDGTQSWLDFTNWTSGGSLWSGSMISVYGPFLAQPTAIRFVNLDNSSSARIYETAGTHSLSTSYPGFNLFPSAGSISGTVSVYGVRS
jgi:hypothetical protein